MGSRGVGVTCWLLSTICLAETEGDGQRRLAVIAEADQGAPGRARTGANLGVVVVSDVSGLDAASLATLRRLVAARLTARRVPLLEDPRLAQPRPIDRETQQIAAEIGASRIYILQPSRLGSKVVFVLHERDVNGAPIYEATLTARTLEESDRVIPRLVDALLDRQSAEDNAQITTVTRQEAEPFQKRPGEKFWAVGLPFGLTGAGAKGAFGLSLGWSYEAENFGVGLQLLSAFAPEFIALLAGIAIPWIPLSGSVSPYIAPGIGYMYLDKDKRKGGGIGFTAEAGVEFFRLHHFRVLVGAQALMPAYTVSGSDSLGRSDTNWVPVFLLHTRIAF